MKLFATNIYRDDAGNTKVDPDKQIIMRDYYSVHKNLRREGDK